jgi:hypothetical protein
MGGVGGCDSGEEQAADDEKDLILDGAGSDDA